MSSPPLATWRRTGDDFGRWSLDNRVPQVAVAWGVLLAVVGLVRDPALTSTAVRATYLLLAVYGLTLLARETGQPSLGHAGFMAAGAYGTALLRLRLGLDGLVAALIAALFAGGLGLLLGWGATRLRPAILALLTWTFGWAVYLGLGAFPGLTGGVAGIAFRAPMRVRWDALGVDVVVGDRGHLALGTLLLAVLLLLYRAAQTSVIGRGWAALRDSRGLARSLGYDVPRVLRNTFAVSAAVAALAGSLGAQALQVVDPSLFSPLQSLNLLVAVLIGAPLGFFGPLLGALVTSGTPFLVDQAGTALALPLGPGRQVAAAVLTIAALALSLRFGGPRTGPAGRPPQEGAEGAGAARPARRRPLKADPPVVLRTETVGIEFDGVRALNGATVTVLGGMVQGLVGPNGSGKSTLLRCMSGTLSGYAGSIWLDGHQIDAISEPARVRLGVTRTFQRTAVMRGLRVLDHVEVGRAVAVPDAAFLQALLRTPRYRAEAAAGREMSRGLLATFGLDAAADAWPDALSTGRQRLLQVATAASSRPRVLLLDEPAAGMDAVELGLLESALAELAAEGCAILLIEHNMSFVARVASRVTVMEAGAVIFEGTPAAAARDAGVRRAYLGVSAAPTRARRRSAPSARRPPRAGSPAAGPAPAPGPGA